MTLKEYKDKRDFTKTKEPEGKKKLSKDKDLIFVVQKHDASRLHYDFRLEWDGVLLSWAVPKGPSYNPKDKRLAVEVEPHPYSYKDFEGTIPKGQYGGGTVMVFDQGTWEIQEGQDVNKGLKEGSLKFILHGDRLKGKWTLVRMKTKDEDQNNWLLIKEKDDYALDESKIEDYDTSVISNRTMDEISKDKEVKKETSEDLPTYQVQLATLGKDLPDTDKWVYEIKYDGYRILAYINYGQIKLLTRNGQDYTNKFPDLVESLKSLEGKMVLDGEVIVTKDQVSDFQSLQKYIKDKIGPKPLYMAFDLLYYDHEDFTPLSLRKRKDKLKEIFDKKNIKYLKYSTDTKANPEELLSSICDSKMEGIICKREDKAYVEGRTKDWIKIKCQNRQEFVIIGFTKTESRTRAFSSLLLGLYKGQDLVYVGRVGTGFTDESSKEIKKKLDPLIKKTPPIKDPPKKRPNESVTWVSPKLLGEVTFTQWTDEGLLRHPSFKGLRTDKAPKEVKEEVEVESNKSSNIIQKKKTSKNKDQVTLTSPDKEIFKGYTKEDLFNYYEKIYDKIYPFLEGRFISIVRCPSGYKEECFYQKNIDDNFKFAKSAEVKLKEGEISDYIYIDSLEGLKELVQYSTTEIHIWGSKIKTVDKPDLLVFDLDPDENMDLTQVKEGVLDLKSILDDLGLESFLKTSGNKGYHVLVPLMENADYKTCKEFSKNVALAMEQKWPKKYTSNMSKEKRKGKIYIDYLRNSKGSTSVAPYSVRAKDLPYVSMPLSWDDLEKIDPKLYNIDNVLENLDKNPWEGFFDVSQKINKKE